MPSSQFRWRFYDEAIGWEWSMWHTHTGECPACCCWGPDDGGHLNRTAHHGDNPLVFSWTYPSGPSPHPAVADCRVARR